MKRSKETVLKLKDNQCNILGHMCYAAYKHWNCLNYERLNYEKLGLESFPDWYRQKKEHKDGFFARSLPSQSSQEVAKLLDKAWKSYFTLLETKGIKNPKPPKFKQENMPITYMQNAIKRDGRCGLRLTLTKKLKEFMRSEYGIEDEYLYISNTVFGSLGDIKQIKLYPPAKGECRCIVVYELPDHVMKEDNGRYLSIDIGVCNPLTCYESANGETFIAGRKYFSIQRKYLKEIERVQVSWYTLQKKKGVKYPKTSKHIQKLYEKMNHSLSDYLHKVTRAIVEYCKARDIHTVVVGDITGIREEKTFFADNVQQNFHTLPFRKLCDLLSYKLEEEGISMVTEKEYYTSQCSPFSMEVSRKYAEPDNRVERGLYRVRGYVFNSDSVGCFNILRRYRKRTGKDITMELPKTSYVMHVAV